MQKRRRAQNEHSQITRNTVYSEAMRCAKYTQEEAIVQQRHSMCEPIKSDQRCSIHHDIVSPPSHFSRAIQ